MKTALDYTEGFEEQLIELRNYLHTFPEVGGQEYRTSKFVEEEMHKLGLETHHLNETCFYAILDTGKPGRTLVMRADMDGLPMDEEPTTILGEKKKTVSENPGMCHACGHDAHTAILMTAIKVLVANVDALKGGKLYFIFEAGEENGFSTNDIDTWVKELKPDGMFGLHVSSAHPTGTISVQAGPRTAGIKAIYATIKGKGGHSSRPDQSINPTVAAANAIMSLQSITNLYTNPLNATTFAITGMSGGTAFNIIPDEIKFMGSFRFTDLETGEVLAEKIHEIIKNAAATYYCTAETEVKNTGALPAVNDPEVSAIAEGALRKVHPEMEANYPVMLGSESMGVYLASVPGCFVWVGTASEELGTTAAHHNGYFEIDESMLKPAMDLSVQFAIDFLDKE